MYLDFPGFGKGADHVHVDAVGEAFGIMYFLHDKVFVQQELCWYGADGFTVGHHVDGQTLCPCFESCLNKRGQVAHGRFETGILKTIRIVSRLLRIGNKRYGGDFLMKNTFEEDVLFRFEEEDHL